MLGTSPKKIWDNIYILGHYWVTIKKHQTVYQLLVMYQVQLATTYYVC